MELEVVERRPLFLLFYHDEIVFFLYHGKEIFWGILFAMIYAVFMSYHGKKKVLSPFITMRSPATMKSHGIKSRGFLLFEESCSATVR